MAGLLGLFHFVLKHAHCCLHPKRTQLRDDLAVSNSVEAHNLGSPEHQDDKDRLPYFMYVKYGDFLVCMIFPDSTWVFLGLRFFLRNRTIVKMFGHSSMF